MVRAMRGVGLLCVLLSGCMGQGNGAAQRFHETVLDMNKNTRWGQIGDAVRWVEPSYQGKFAQTHMAWGEDIQLADSEVVSIQMAPDQESAIALVSYQWYRTADMNLYTTIVQQRWSQVGENFLLMSERVVKGEVALLATPSGNSLSADAQSLAPPG